MKPTDAIEIRPSPDLGETSLVDAATLLGSYGRSYTITVCPAAEITTAHLLKTLGCATKDNPFAPYVNLKVDPSYSHWEWSLTIDDRTAWSSGA